MADRLVLLGTGTCQLLPERRASSVLIEVGASRVVFDMGRGIADRLAELGLRQDDVGHVLISHFHADHVSDLVPYLHAASWSQLDSRSRDLEIVGPAGLERLVETMVEALGRDSLIRPGGYEVRIREAEAGPLRIGGLSGEYVSLPPAGNHGFAFTHRGRRMAITGDSGFHGQEIEFLRGADLAVIDSGHLSDEEIVRLAVDSGARRIVCSHLYRELDIAALGGAAAARGYAGELSVGADGMSLPL
jgi:ribonuclease BN (tRNA processing enzyme)